MTANPYNLPKSVEHASTGERRIVRTAIDYQNLLARGYRDLAPKPAAAAKTPAASKSADADTK